MYGIVKYSVSESKVQGNSKIFKPRRHAETKWGKKLPSAIALAKEMWDITSSETMLVSLLLVSASGIITLFISIIIGPAVGIACVVQTWNAAPFNIVTH